MSSSSVKTNSQAPRPCLVSSAVGNSSKASSTVSSVTPVKFAGTKFYTTSPSPKALPIPVFKLNGVGGQTVSPTSYSNSSSLSSLNSQPLSCSLPLESKLHIQYNSTTLSAATARATLIPSTDLSANSQYSHPSTEANQTNSSLKSNSAPSSPPKPQNPFRRPSNPPKAVFEKAPAVQYKTGKVKSVNLNASFISETKSIPKKVSRNNLTEEKTKLDPSKVTILKRPDNLSCDVNVSLSADASHSSPQASLEAISATLKQMLKLKA